MPLPCHLLPPLF
uniref:Uncharacterized protein n=1 Tax=Rhizophora mucronata TaxID=61149 RepID=A0A2P2P9Q6_RHIMU